MNPILRAPPGKRRVLSVVLTTHIVPLETERVHVALRRFGQRKTIRGRMARVIEVERLGSVGIDSFDAFGRHVSFAVGWLHVWTRLLTAAAILDVFVAYLVPLAPWAAAGL